MGLLVVAVADSDGHELTIPIRRQGNARGTPLLLTNTRVSGRYLLMRCRSATAVTPETAPSIAYGHCVSHHVDITTHGEPPPVAASNKANSRPPTRRERSQMTTWATPARDKEERAIVLAKPSSSNVAGAQRKTPPIRTVAAPKGPATTPTTTWATMTAITGSRNCWERFCASTTIEVVGKVLPGVSGARYIYGLRQTSWVGIHDVAVDDEARSPLRYWSVGVQGIEVETNS